MKNRFMTVGVVGLGLIGGSMAKSIRNGCECKILGFDTNAETMELAKMSKTIDADLTSESISECNLILIAVAPESLISWVEANAHLIPSSTVLVDLCGVKRVIMDAIEPLATRFGFTYVGGHPMAGKEVAGFKNADSALFWGASMILTPPAGTGIEVLSDLKAFFLSLGFTSVVFSDKDEHDRIIAYTSQLAHITSSAYIKSPTARSYMGFSAGSYKDMTRVAKLDPNMWTQLFLDNADNLEGELETLVNNLTDYLDALKSRDAQKLHALLSDGLKIKLEELGETSYENKA